MKAAVSFSGFKLTVYYSRSFMWGTDLPSGDAPAVSHKIFAASCYA